MGARLTESLPLPARGLSKLASFPRVVQRLGYRRTASAGLRRLAAWLERPCEQRLTTPATPPSPPSASNADAATPSLISPAYVAFQEMPARVISRYLNLSGRQILEIGGAQASLSGRAFLNAGAARVVVSGLDHIEQEGATDDERLVILRADGLDLLRHLEPASFDVVFGLSIIEHIPNPRRFLEQVQAVLKPGGLALLEGYPLWSSALGHHLWVASWGGTYQGRTDANYLFTPIANVPASNPIADWGHLLMNESELEQSLLAQSLPPDDIASILDWVYHNPEINRLDTKELCTAYTSSALVVLEATTRRDEVPPHVLTQLRERHGEGCDYGLSGLTFVLAKPG